MLASLFDNLTWGGGASHVGLMPMFAATPLATTISVAVNVEPPKHFALVES